MSLVSLVSGGLDSTLVSVLAQEAGIEQYPLFIDYGQICKDQEWQTCLRVHAKLNLPQPICMNLTGFGQLISSGLTDSSKRVNEDAFLPGRNLLFLLAGCAYAYQVNANAVAIGLLSEEAHLFPDQTKGFVESAQAVISKAISRDVKIVTPLIEFRKQDVFNLARSYGIDEFYSCHAGTIPPCGECISCLEYENIK